MREVQTIAVVADDFALGTSGQQLLDRFLIGYPRDGAMYRPDWRVRAFAPSGKGSAELDRRVNDFALGRAGGLSDVLRGVDAVVVVPGERAAADPAAFVRGVLSAVPRTCPCFVHGTLDRDLAGSRALVDLAVSRKIPLAAGTALAVTWRLPPVEIEPGTALAEALIITQGDSSTAAFEGLEGILSLVDRRAGGESGLRAVELLRGPQVWEASGKGRWSMDLLAAAISRSDSPQGDPVRDGRTQDIVGLGLVPGLARDPLAWLVEHRDGLRSSILILDGVVADIDFAVRTKGGEVISAQIYRPPEPARHEFSRLAEVIETFFTGARPPWPVERSLLMVGALEVFDRLSRSDRNDGLVETPGLAISYS